VGPTLDHFRDPVLLLLGALAVSRLTRLLVADELLAAPRARIVRWAEGTAERRAHPQLGYLATCPWCVSVWVAAGWALLVALAPAAALVAGAILAWSAAAGLLASWE